MLTTGNETSSFSLAVYSADLWEHVCPVIRITEPAKLSGVRILRGNTWDENGVVQVDPRHITDADLVLVQRNFPAYPEQYQRVVTQARQADKPLVYELDDLLPELPPTHPDLYHYVTARSAIINAIVQSDAVIGSTPALCEYMRQFNENVILLPNYLDDSLWQMREPALAHENTVIIGYMGGHSHSDDLELIAPALLRILEKYGNKVQLKFWGVAPPAGIRNAPQVSWITPGLVSYRDFVEYFSNQAVDIFLAPLQDNLFNRCKSHLKFLEYSALAAAGVYSRIQTYSSIVRHGENGFLASSTDEWEESLSRLIEEPALRLQISSQAQKTVRRSWLLSEHAAQWAQVYQDILDPSIKVALSPTAINTAQKLQGWQHDLELRLQESAQRITRLESQLQDAHKHIDSQRDQITVVYGLYKDILESNSWKLLEWLFAIRKRVVPPSSRREQLARLGFHSLQVLRREGPLAFIRGAYRGLRSLVTHQPGPSSLSPVEPAAPVTVALQDGFSCQLPAITVILLAEPEQAHLEDAALEWVRNQTCAGWLELVRWDASSGQAYRLFPQQGEWSAGDVPTLFGSLSSRYIALFSADLLEQDRLYLETNLVALTSEKLAFTVNLTAHDTRTLQLVSQGRLPGDEQQPLLRQVVEKSCLAADLTIDLAGWLAAREGYPGIAGKILLHTTGDRQRDENLPLESSLPRLDWIMHGRNFMARARSEILWFPHHHRIHPVSTVLPASPVEPDPRPTVLMVQPFLAVGGAEQLALHIMEALQDRFRFIHVTTDELDSSLGTLADSFRQITPHVYNFADFLEPSLRLSMLETLVDRFQVQTLYIHNGADWIYDALPHIKQRCPHLRVVNQVYDYRVGWINRYDLDLVMNIDAHIAAYDRISQAYIEKGVSPKQVFQIEHTVNPAHLDPNGYQDWNLLEIKRKLGLPLGTKVVTFASRLHPQKRPLDFVELARRFSSDSTVAFLMLGDGALAGTVDQQVGQLGLHNLVRQPFYRPISDVLAITDVLVLPSEYEGMPLIVSEAQVMGKPAVVTDVGNNRHVLATTGGGVVVAQVGDLGALYQGVRQMLDSPPDPNKIRQAWISHFGVAVIAEKYRAVLLGEQHA